MKKAAYVASLMIHFKSFHLSVLKMLQDNGFETTLIASDDLELPYCDKKFKVPIERSPLKLNNLKAYFELKNIFRSEEFDIIHCHTPVASLLTRLAARKMRKNGTKIIYTAHGFHFFKGAPLLNWLIYFPIEWISSFFTDVLITINREDFDFAKKHMHPKKVVYVPGVGIDTEKISAVNIDRNEKRKELGILADDIAVLSIGELNDNKNHETVIRAISKLGLNNVCYVICGKGKKEEYLIKLAKELNVNLKLLGYRNDIPQICKSCDIFVFPSKREGLPVSVIEAMAAGMPCVVSKIRGNTDLIDCKNGYLSPALDVGCFAEKIKILIENKEVREKLGQNNIEEAKKYDIENVCTQIKQIYQL